MKFKEPFISILEQQQMWQNQNKISNVATGRDLVNYSELYHPYSHHNVATGNDKPLIMPSDLQDAQDRV